MQFYNIQDLHLYLLQIKELKLVDAILQHMELSA